ncbi:response regulator transcription factor [Alkalihalophilus marmarensis]|jgi:DNA-binding NarL/FixJ family response regulator|uniref:response regulator transcription factor n=1 Tax=Alkalihalophilus marmarensis TaxID=521377 RepID=UPI00203BA577|nr:response regulator transcription factor [Alkalihalophilus marmarensis]MCM3491038.1 response regulator transcription factor [Alkalihalophilus marmarensis]
MMIKVIIVDDHQMVRRGLRFFLDTQNDIEIVGEAANGEEAVKLVQTVRPDVVLMDIVMPVMSGIEATKQLIKVNPELKILVLTSFSDQDYVIPALKAGASGYQLKDIDPEELAETIRALHAGESKVHSKVMKYVLTRITHKVDEEEAKVNRLTKREKEVLIELAKGRSNKELADVLHITEKTVKTHISNILSKLELSDRTQAALFAMRMGLK